MRRLRITIRLFMILLAALLFPVSISGATILPLQTANDLFAAGNAFYRAQKYEEAREAYRQLLEGGYDTAPVLYNLGTVDARLGSNTLASAYLMRARNLRPRSGNIRANLAYVTPQPTAAGSAKEDTASVESLWSRISGYLTVDEWLAVLWCALMLSCCAGAALIITRRSSRIHLLARVVLWTAAVMAVIVSAPAATRFYDQRIATKSIILTPTEMLSGPASRFTRIANIGEGQIVRHLGDAQSGFNHVRLENGLQGYVDADSLMQL